MARDDLGKAQFRDQTGSEGNTDGSNTHEEGEMEDASGDGIQEV